MQSKQSKCEFRARRGNRGEGESTGDGQGGGDCEELSRSRGCQHTHTEYKQHKQNQDYYRFPSNLGMQAYLSLLSIVIILVWHVVLFLDKKFQ